MLLKIAFILPLALLSGCRLGLDREYCADTSISSQAILDPDDVRERQADAELLESGPKRPTLFGLMPDNTGKYLRMRATAEREAARDEPTHAEQRMAKAEAIARVDIQRRSLGDTVVRTDGSSSKAGEVRYVPSPRALTLHIEASPDLNRIDGSPHAILLVVYHLSDTTQFRGLSTHEEGIRKLLEGKAFHRSVKSVETLSIQPGTTDTVRFDRPDNGQYVAIVAGYGDGAFIDAPVASYGVGKYKIRQAAFRQAIDMYAPLPLNLHVALGPDRYAVYDQGHIPDPIITRAVALQDQIQTIY